MKMQKAWYYEEYGPKEVLKLGDITVPFPGENQLLVQVCAAALNPIDFKLRRNPLGPIDLPVVPGCDMAGVVVSIGHGVTKFKAGNEVYANIQDFNRKNNKLKQLGTLAQFTLVEEYLAALKPKKLSFVEAACLPLAAQTSFEGFKVSSFKENASIFVVGGAGGVGSLVVQLAKRVFKASLVGASTSTGKVEFVKGLGADKVLDYTKGGYEDVGEKYDLVYDTVGKSNYGRNLIKYYSNFYSLT